MAGAAARARDQAADTPANRVELQKLAGIVAAMIRAERDPLCLFEAEKRPTAPAAAEKTTVREYFARWITDKQPPIVRPAQARDYRRHIEQYVLPRLGDVAIADLSPRDILGVRGELLNDGLSVKYVKNILGASFKAMIRDAREIDRVLERDPFVGVRWPRVEVPGPDPLTPTERARILRWFEVRRFSFHAGGSTDSMRGVRIRTTTPTCPVVLDGHAPERGVGAAPGGRRPRRPHAARRAVATPV